MSGRNDYDKAEQMAKDKLALSERGVKLVCPASLDRPVVTVLIVLDVYSQLSRHLNRLSAQLELLTPNVPPLPVLPTFAPVMAPVPNPAHYNQVYANNPAAAASANQLLQQQAQLQQQQQFHAAYPAGNFGMGTGSTAISGYSYATNGDGKSSRFRSTFSRISH